ncbi:MAG: IS1380 family transposase [Acidobacteria bacterium]|nr:MAG: IS1380 family transposase [Acidobacteriota bacterium]
MVDPTLPLPGLSPIEGKEIVARFDGGRLSSDGGLLVLREIEQRLKVADRLAACIDDPRDPASTVHTVADIIRFRMLMIAAGYEDGNDSTGLRTDPVFKLALERLPSDRDLCSQSTISRLENLPDARTLLRLGRALVDVYCGSFRQVPKRIVLDIDDTFDAVHGGQQLRLFNAHYDEYGFQPIVVFDAEGRFVTALLRPAKRPKGVEIRAFLRRLIRAIRAHWPQVEILLRADSHYACPDVMDWCETNRLDYVFGLAPNSTLRRHITGLEESTAARFKAAPTAGKVRRFKEFFDAAKTWSRVRRIVARVEAGGDGTDTRFIVTSLGHGSGRSLYQDLYCRRGQAENHIKAWKTHLAADRTSCHKATANQFRLFLHAGAYWLLWSLRALMPKRSSWRVAQFDTLRLRLIKTAARIVEMKTRIKIHLPTSAPDQAIWHLVLRRLPRLVT